MKTIYDIESQAFQGVRNQPGVVQYLGEYMLQHPTIDYPDSPSRHIMLEYGEMDLDEYLAETYPPILNAEIREFWEELFSVARTLERIQNLEYENRDGTRQNYRGQVKVRRECRLQWLTRSSQVAWRHQTRQHSASSGQVQAGRLRICEIRAWTERENENLPSRRYSDVWYGSVRFFFSS